MKKHLSYVLFIAGSICCVAGSAICQPDEDINALRQDVLEYRVSVVSYHERIETERRERGLRHRELENEQNLQRRDAILQEITDNRRNVEERLPNDRAEIRSQVIGVHEKLRGTLEKLLGQGLSIADISDRLEGIGTFVNLPSPYQEIDGPWSPENRPQKWPQDTPGILVYYHELRIDETQTIFVFNVRYRTLDNTNDLGIFCLVRDGQKTETWDILAAENSIIGPAGNFDYHTLLGVVPQEGGFPFIYTYHGPAGTMADLGAYFWVYDAAGDEWARKSAVSRDSVFRPPFLDSDGRLLVPYTKDGGEATLAIFEYGKGVTEIPYPIPKWQGLNLK